MSQTLSTVAILAEDAKSSVTKKGVAITTLAIRIPNTWIGKDDEVHTGRPHLYRVRYYGEQAKAVKRLAEKGRKVSITGFVDWKGYRKVANRERKFFCYLNGDSFRVIHSAAGGA